jgi:hypothetical protein
MSVLTRRAAGFAAIALMMSASAALAQSPPAGPPARVRGTIEKVDGNVLTVKTLSGDTTTLKLADNVRIGGLVKISAADVKQNDYVGVSSMPQTDGTLKAISIHIFPEAGRGTAEGHGPWDNRPGAMMTNAAVDTKVASANGETIVVKYKGGGEQKVVVGSDAVIVRVMPGDKAELVPGAKIWAVAPKGPDGSLTAVVLYVGRDGLQPPM